MLLLLNLSSLSFFSSFQVVLHSTNPSTRSPSYVRFNSQTVLSSKYYLPSYDDCDFAGGRLLRGAAPPLRKGGPRPRPPPGPPPTRVRTTRRIWNPFASRLSLGSALSSPQRVAGVSSLPTAATESENAECKNSTISITAIIHHHQTAKFEEIPLTVGQTKGLHQKEIALHRC